MILAGDIGGTKTNIAFFEEGDPSFTPLALRTYQSRDYAGLEAILEDFLARDRYRPKRACFGIAGPVRDGYCEASNFHWEVDSRRVAAQLRIDRVGLLNDLEATAYGVGILRPESLYTLHAGSPYPGHAALVAAGTGLGEAFLFWDGQQHHPGACEGGHSEFGPRSELEIKLLRYLYTQYDHVSYERIVSGPGLFNIYQFLRDTGACAEPRQFADELAAQQDPSPLISSAALRGAPEICVRALDLFVSVYGAEAGNLALKVWATQGVYVAGGIAPKILEKLKDGTFISAFFDKGRFRSVMETLPVYVVLDDKTAMKGAARYASKLSAD